MGKLWTQEKASCAWIFSLATFLKYSLGQFSVLSSVVLALSSSREGQEETHTGKHSAVSPPLRARPLHGSWS